MSRYPKTSTHEFGFHLPVVLSTQLDIFRGSFKALFPDRPIPSRSAVVRVILGAVLGLGDAEQYLLIEASQGDLEKLGGFIRRAVVNQLEREMVDSR